MASPPTQMTAALALRKARAQRDENLDRVAERTLISKQYLEALENDAPLSAFPSPMYARLFLRTYARYLGLDEEPLVRAFSSRHGANPSPAPGIPPAAAPPRSVLGAVPNSRAVTSVPTLAPRARKSTRDRIRIAWATRRSGKVLPGKRAAPSRRSAVSVAAVTVVVMALIAFPFVRSMVSSKPSLTHRVAPPPTPKLPWGSRTILPGHRLVAFYGGDRTPALGVLGGVPPDEVAVKLQRQAKGYEQGDTPIVPVFELITVVASFHPGPDNLYRFRDDPGVVQGYIDAIRKVHGLMVIDIQPGRADFMTEIKPYEQFLKQPDVGLALDGEWHVGPDQVPGVVIGNITADTVNQVSAYLSGIVQRNNLPQKLLIIHQFTEGEIHDRARIITDRPGLAMVLDIDGFGGALTKTLKYQGLTAGTDRYYHGIKLYYGQDVNLMSPMQVLALRPSPDIIIYQ